MSGLKNHGRFDRLTSHSIERNLDLAAGIDPMAKGVVVPFPGSSVTVAVPSAPRLKFMDGPACASSRGGDRYVPTNFEWVVVLAESTAADASNQIAQAAA
jgi:hypothetical protein